MTKSFALLALSIFAASAFSGAPPKKAETAFADAIAAWHFGDLQSADGKSPLTLQGAAKTGIDLPGPEKAESLKRGGDGKVADVAPGAFFMRPASEGPLNLRGEAMSMLLRFRNPIGKWSSGELFCKHGGHDKLVYNLFVNGDRLGFEFGAEGKTGLAGQVNVNLSDLKPDQWHDLIVRYDGAFLTLFVDGFAVARSKASGTLRQGNTEPVMIGRRGFTGQIDHAALWPRALDDEEIVALSGGEAVIKARRELLAKQIEAKIGREGLTLADQLRAARELRQRLWNDPHRPRYHLLPPDGFWNDINGTIFWKGRYHVFFLGRLAPDRDTILSGKDSDHARETWLHASSADLVHWIHHPPALVPVFDGSMPSGIYSGDMMDNMPVPTIIVHVPGQGTCLFTAEDDELIRWQPHPKNPVIPSAGAPSQAVIFDPCGWKDGERYYALVGNKNSTPGFEGDSTSLFRSSDLEHWEYRGPFYKSERRWTADYEDCACPDFFPLGDRHVLISHVHRPWNHLQYYIGKLDQQAERFLPESHGYMSWPGGSICAPETLLDGKGRRIFWGWIMEARPASNGWGSVASLPRVLSLDPDHSLRIEPAPELEVLRNNPRHFEGLAISGERVLEEVRGDCLEVSARIEPAGARAFGITVRRSPDAAEQTHITCNPGDKTLKIVFAKSTLDPAVKYEACSARFAEEHNIPAEQRRVTEQIAPFELKPGEPLQLRVFLDRSVLEVFANGRQCITQRIYPSRPDSLGVSLFAREGTARFSSLDAWSISPANSW